MIERTYTISFLCSACNSALDMTEDRKCRKCGHDFGPPPPPDTNITLPDMDYHWIRPGECAWLDGLFTAADLRRIADAIEGKSGQLRLTAAYMNNLAKRLRDAATAEGWIGDAETDHVLVEAAEVFAAAAAESEAEAI